MSENKPQEISPSGTPSCPSFDDLPPAVQAALKAKGWDYPISEERKRERAKARESLKFDDDIPPEIQKESWELVRGALLG